MAARGGGGVGGAGQVSRSAKRLERELQEMTAAGLFPCEVVGSVSERWVVTMRGAEGTFYAGEVFRLQFTFSREYPIDSPEVIFLPPAPIHPHIYSNGHICLSILYQGGWSPALKVESVCMSILSMLSSAERKAKPEDNDRYVATCKQSPKHTMESTEGLKGGAARKQTIVPLYPGRPHYQEHQVVSIYGNTGDGKSYALNKCFFDGAHVFNTSASQASCTCGAWVALEPRSNTVVIDTEGMLAVSDNENERKRLLLKVLAVSDIVIYVTRAERLHQDMFSFLEDASGAYCKYFQKELESAAARTNNQQAVSSVGPGLILFHETRNTEVLESDINTNLIDRFSAAANKAIRSFPLAYSDVVYCGQRKPDGGATDFSPLRRAVVAFLSRNSVRLPRVPAVLFHQLTALNAKFTGAICSDAVFVGGILPDLLFRCPKRCYACGNQCMHTVSHDEKTLPHDSSSACKFVAAYSNEEYTCRACYRNGQRRLVAKVESTSFGVKWGAQWHCPKCSVVHTESFYGGEKDRQRLLEQLQAHCVHVWAEVPAGLDASGNSNMARRALETLRSATGVVAAAAELPVAAAVGKVVDWTRPAYWVPDDDVLACYACAVPLAAKAPKHHCRRCGQGFCNACSMGRHTVKEHGWLSPVRVCQPCLEILEREEREEEAGKPGIEIDPFDDSDSEVCVITSASLSLPSEDQTQPVLPPAVWSSVQAIQAIHQPNLGRKGLETIFTTASYVHDTFEEVGRSIADMSNPSYWQREREGVATVCIVCARLLLDKTARPGGGAAGGGGGGGGSVAVAVAGAENREDTVASVDNLAGNGVKKPRELEELSRHHCRACGCFVCTDCSRSTLPVPSRGWLEDVRVCDTCAAKPGPL